MLTKLLHVLATVADRLRCCGCWEVGCLHHLIVRHSNLPCHQRNRVSAKEKICESLHYWLSFIDNACSTAEGRSHVVIVGSHADQVTSSVEEKRESSSLLQEIATRRVKHQQYTGYLSMDCRYADTDASHCLISSPPARKPSLPVSPSSTTILTSSTRSCVPS